MGDLSMGDPPSDHSSLTSAGSAGSPTFQRPLISPFINELDSELQSLISSLNLHEATVDERQITLVDLLIEHKIRTAAQLFNASIDIHDDIYDRIDSIASRKQFRKLLVQVKPEGPTLNEDNSLCENSIIIKIDVDPIRDPKLAPENAIRRHIWMPEGVIDRVATQAVNEPIPVISLIGW